MSDSHISYNPHKIALSEIQKAKSRTCYMDFDFDNVEIEDIVSQIKLNSDSYEILKTRGGFHLLVDPSKIEDSYLKNWYPNISKLPGCDVRGDNLIPVQGCAQGGFEPYLI